MDAGRGVLVGGNTRRRDEAPLTAAVQLRAALRPFRPLRSLTGSDLGRAISCFRTPMAFCFAHLCRRPGKRQCSEERCALLRALPSFRQARLNLPHVVPNRLGAGFQEHGQRASGLVAERDQTPGLQPEEVERSQSARAMPNSTVLTVWPTSSSCSGPDRRWARRGLGRLQSILSNKLQPISRVPSSHPAECCWSARPLR